LTDPNENKLVHDERPKHSEPHFGHDGTNYEGTDAKAGTVIGSLAVIGLTLVITFVLTIGIQKYMESTTPVGQSPSPLAPARVIPSGPLLQVHPWDSYPQLREQEDKILNGSGKDAAGHTHIPIDQAMAAVVSRLNVKPGAPQGITTPGGEGRDFAGSVTNMPSQYRTAPQIEGEVQKNAPQQ
jgi:hypothetical protein